MVWQHDRLAITNKYPPRPLGTVETHTYIHCGGWTQPLILTLGAQTLLGRQGA